MDPDLVRQQAEEEAASRILSRHGMPPDMRVEPVLPMAKPREMPPVKPERAVAPHQAARAAPAIAMRSWRVGFGIAASCVLGSTVGLVGGVMLGVKLHLVPGQGALIASAAALVLGWQAASAGLIRRGGLGTLRAIGVGLRGSLVVLAVMSGAMFVAPHYLGAAASPKAPFEIGVFWRSIAAGAMVAMVLGGLVMRSAIDHAKAARR